MLNKTIYILDESGTARAVSDPEYGDPADFELLGKYYFQSISKIQIYNIQ